MNSKEQFQLEEAIIHVVDEIIETEDAFGMTFGDVGFEARYKCNNTCAYPKRKLTENDYIPILNSIREYLAYQRYEKRFNKNNDIDIAGAICCAMDEYKKIQYPEIDEDEFVRKSLERVI